MDYWQITIEESMSEAGIDATPEQVSQVVKAVDFAHSSYGEQHGHREADKSLKRMQESKQRDRVFNFVHQRIQSLESADIFERLNHRQRLSMHELFNAKEFFEKENRE